MKTPWNSTFPRNPNYTPASLSPESLLRVERLARVRFNRSFRENTAFYGGEGAGGRFSHFLLTNHSSHPRNTIASIIRDNPEAERYFESCVNYLVAIARNQGWLLFHKR